MTQINPNLIQLKQLQYSNAQSITNNMESIAEEITEVFNPLGEDAGTPGICKIKGKTIIRVGGRVGGKLVGKLIGGIPGYIAWGVGETLVRHYVLGQGWKQAAMEGFSPI